MDHSKMPAMTLAELDEQITRLNSELQGYINGQFQCQGALNVLRYWKEKAEEKIKAVEKVVEKVNAENEAAFAEEIAAVKAPAEDPPKTT